MSGYEGKKIRLAMLGMFVFGFTWKQDVFHFSFVLRSEKREITLDASGIKLWKAFLMGGIHFKG